MANSQKRILLKEEIIQNNKGHNVWSGRMERLRERYGTRTRTEEVKSDPLRSLDPTVAKNSCWRRDNNKIARPESFGIPADLESSQKTSGTTRRGLLSRSLHSHAHDKASR